MEVEKNELLDNGEPDTYCLSQVIGADINNDKLCRQYATFACDMMRMVLFVIFLPSEMFICDFPPICKTLCKFQLTNA